MTAVLASGAGVQLDMPIAAILALCAALLVLSFVFSGTETAMFSLQKVDLQRAETDGSLGRRIVSLLRDRGALITTILMGNETVNVLLAATGNQLFAHATPWESVNSLLNVAIITPTLVLLSEITPKVIAFRFNTTWARVAAWPLTVFYWVVTPPRLLIGLIVRGLLRLAGVDPLQRPEGLREAELLTILDQSAEAGTVGRTEVDLVGNVFEFDKLTLQRVMTPRPDIFAVPLDLAWTELLFRCRASGYSRVPVFDGRMDDVVGVLIVKDLLKHRHAPVSPRQLRSLLIPPTFVPQSKSANDMMTEFLERKFHMALVVNEHGTLVGLVTLDDLLIELFGDLATDTEDVEEIDQSHPGRFSVKAWMDIDDFAEHTSIQLPAGDYHTVGGFVFHTLGHLPRRGDAVTLNGHRFVVRDMDGRRIAQIDITPDGDPEQEAV